MSKSSKQIPRYLQTAEKMRAILEQAKKENWSESLIHKKLSALAGRYEISTREFNKELLKNFNFAKDRVKAQGGLHPQIIVLMSHNEQEMKKAWENRKREMIVIALAGDIDFNTSESKSKIMKGLGLKIANDFPKQMPVAVFMMSEAWIRVLPNLKDLKDLPDNWREMGGKSEAIVVSGLTIDQRCGLATAVMHKPKTKAKKQVVMLSDETVVKYEKSKGEDKNVPYILRDFYTGYFLAKKKEELAKVGISL